MQPIIVECNLLQKTWFKGIMIFPFIVLDRKINRKNVTNHETIHFEQAKELLVILFYVIYILNYLINLIRFRNHSDAYLNVIFEKEAYKYQHNMNYLNKRKAYAWLR